MLGVTAENIRKGHFVASIRFTVEEKKQILLDKEQAELLAREAEEVEDDNQIKLIGVLEDETVDIDDPNDPLALCASALPADFTRAQVELLRNLAVEHLPYTIASMAEKDLWLHDYLHQKTLLMKASPNVISPFAWLRQAVAEDWK